MQFWVKFPESIELMGLNESHCAVATEWAPDSRLFMTAVMHPRVRVDNEFTIFNNYGVALKKISLSTTELY